MEYEQEGEIHYLETQLALFQQALEGLPAQLEEARFKIERQKENLQQEAGILRQVKALSNQLESYQAGLQSQADQLMGKIAVIKEVKERYHKPDFSHLIPKEEGKPRTHMHGIELADYTHDVDTLGRILEGNVDTIQVLGGVLEPVETESVVKDQLSIREEREEIEDLLDGVL